MIANVGAKAHNSKKRNTKSVLWKVSKYKFLVKRTSVAPSNSFDRIIFSFDISG